MKLRLLSISILIAFGIAIGACSTRSFIKPRSQIIEEAVSRGEYVPSIQEENALFNANEENQKQRLLALIRKRSHSEFRERSYRLGPGDEIEINVFDVPELNMTAPVRQSGFVSLPLVGAVKASGYTESEFADELKRRLSAFVRSPQVSIFVTNYAGHKVAVMGAIKQPGSYSLKKGANSLLELLSQAGGVSERAGNFLVFIPAELSGVSAENDAEERARLAMSMGKEDVRSSGIEIYLDQILATGGGIPLEIPVRGGDMLIVPEAGKVMVEGEVFKGGSYEIGQQYTLLSALAAAGGITYGAKYDEVEVIREIGLNKKVRKIVDLEKIGSGEEKDVRIRNGDIVRIPSDSSRRLRQDTYESISKIINFGVGGNVNVVK